MFLDPRPSLRCWSGTHLRFVPDVPTPTAPRLMWFGWRREIVEPCSGGLRQ